MNIAIIASGSQGDVQPYIALAVGLKRAGFIPRLISNENYAHAIKTHGLEFYPMQGDIQALMDSPELRELLEKGNFMAINAFASKEIKRYAPHWAKDTLEACRDVQAILAGVGGVFTGLAIAEKLDLPIVQAPVFPFTPTSEFPGSLVPPNFSKLGGLFNQLSHELVRQAMWQSVKVGDQIVRKTLELPSAPLFGPYGSPRLNQYPTLYGFSPSVIKPPNDWKNAIVTGYWFLEAEDQWRPPAELEQFLQNGPQPVYIGFGSMGSRDPERTAQLVLEAIAKTGQRAILQSGWNGLRNDNLPKSVHMIGSTPHSWLFPRVAAVVHHGGAGTTAAGLRAGVPSIITPFFGDQPFWGGRVYELGVGPRAIARKQLSADNLAQAITEAVTNSGMREKAAALGAKIRAEDGIGKVVQILQDRIKPERKK
jgi:sterol 3beta-glucosyltransferase